MTTATDIDPQIGEPATLTGLVLNAAQRHPGVALQFLGEGRTAYVSHSELGTIASEIARGLITLGIEHSGARVILGDTVAQAAKIEQVHDRLTALEHVVVLEPGTPHAVPLEELRGRGLELAPGVVADRLAAIGPEEVATLVYTSGTTGLPTSPRTSRPSPPIRGCGRRSRGMWMPSTPGWPGSSRSSASRSSTTTGRRPRAS